MVGLIAFIAIVWWWAECCDYGPLHRPSFRTPRGARTMAAQSARQQVDDIFQSGANEMIRIKTGREFW